MTFIHMANTSITVIPVVVSLQDTLCAAAGFGTAEATINVRTIGDVTCRINGLTNTIYNWIDPTSAAPGSPSHQIKRGFHTGNVDLQSDPGFGPFANVWENVGTGAFWGFVCFSGGSFTCEVSFTVSIRQGTGTVDDEAQFPTLDTAVWTIRGIVI